MPPGSDSDVGAPPGLQVPSYGPAWLGSVLPSLAHMLTGSHPQHTVIGTPGLTGHARAAIVVLADGLGHAQVRERSGHAPFLGTLATHRMTSGAPSTTATSLGSLGTGLAPGSTAMAGYSLRIPGSDSTFSLVAWDAPIEPERWQQHDTVLEWLAERGVQVTTVGRARFATSGLTRAALRGGSYRTAESGEAAVDAAIAAARGRGPSLTYVYWGDIDKIGHRYGWRSMQWGAAVEEFDAAMARLVAGAPRDCQVVVTADHGMVDFDPRTRVDLASNSRLAAGVAVLAGEPRALHVYCQPGQSDAVAGAWRDELGECAWVLTKDQAAQVGLWGPKVSDTCCAVVGDVIALMAGRATVVDSRTQKPGMLSMLGHHGSLTSDECDIPLWVSPGRR